MSKGHLLRGNTAAVLGAVTVLLVGAASSLFAAPAGGLQYEVLPLFRSDHNHLLVRTQINDKPATLVVDTGAPVSAVSLDRAKHFGLTRVSPKSNLPAALNINGAFSRLSIARNIRLGAVNLVDEPMVLISVPEHQGSGKLEGDGILGTDVLSPLKAVLDFDRMLLVLKIDSTVPGPVPGFDYSGFRRIRMQESEGGNLYVRGSINGTKARLMVDTGAPGTLLHSQFVIRMKIPTQKTRFSSIGVNLPESRLHLAEISNLSVGSMNMQSSRVGVINLTRVIHGELDATPPVAGLLGSQMLHDYHAIIDFGTKSLYLKAETLKR